MKKLSFIMAVLMILMCMPIMSVTSVSAADDTSVETEYTGKGVDIELPADWATVSEASAKGYVWDGETKVLVDTLPNAAAIAKANIGKQVVFYLTKTYEASKTIGYGNANYAIMDLSGGANLVIDGQGEYSILNTNPGSSNPGRLFRFDSGDGKGILGFRNITLNTGEGLAGGCVEFGANSLKFLSMKNVELVIPTLGNNWGFVVKCDAELDNVTRDCKGYNGLHLEANGIEVKVKNCTFTNVASAIVSDTSKATLGKLEVDGLTVTNLTYNVFDKIKFQSGEDKGIFAKNLNITGKSDNGNAIFDVITGNVTLYSATLDKMNFVISNVEGNVTVYDVKSETLQRFIGRASGNGLKGNLLVEYADVIMSKAFYDHGKWSGNIVINGGSFVSTGDCIFYFSNSDKSTITINDGDFTVENSDKNVILLPNSSGSGKSITINGGTFNSWNKDVNVTTNDSVSSQSTVKPIIYAICDTVNINGGVFNLYKDAGNTFADKGIHTAACGTANPQINITGGTFNGGQYVNVTGTVAISEASKIPMPALEEGQTSTCYDISIATTKGASIRTNADTSGIRFQGKIGKHAIEYMTNYFANGKDVYCGVAIVPEDYLTATNGVFTYEALTAAGLEWATTNASNGKITKADGSSTINIALTGIKEGNYNRDFVAIAYVYADNDGNQKVSDGDTVFYAGKTSDARSVSETAKAALADVKNTSTGDYCTELTSGYYYVNNSDGTYTKTEITNAVYSRFTLTQLEALKKYA